MKNSNKKCRSLFKSTLNTRALPTGNLQYIRSDFPDSLTDDEVKWLLKNDITFIIDLREEKEYRKKHCRLEDEENFCYLHMPVTGGNIVPSSPEAVAKSYLAMMDTQMDKIIDTILTAKQNVLFSAVQERTERVSCLPFC